MFHLAQLLSTKKILLFPPSLGSRRGEPICADSLLIVYTVVYTHPTVPSEVSVPGAWRTCLAL